MLSRPSLSRKVLNASAKSLSNFCGGFTHTEIVLVISGAYSVQENVLTILGNSNFMSLSFYGKELSSFTTVKSPFVPAVDE